MARSGNGAGGYVSAIQDPGAGGPADLINEAAAKARQHPMLHFVMSEIQAGIASLTVYAFFLLFSYLAERLTDTFPLRNDGPAHFMDLVFAWGASFSGALTFLLYTLAGIVRLVRQVVRGDF